MHIEHCLFPSTENAFVHHFIVVWAFCLWSSLLVCLQLIYSTDANNSLYVAAFGI